MVAARLPRPGLLKVSNLRLGFQHARPLTWWQYATVHPQPSVDLGRESGNGSCIIIHVISSLCHISFAKIVDSTLPRGPETKVLIQHFGAE